MWGKFRNCVTILVRRASETLRQHLLHILFQECVSKQPPHVTGSSHLPIKIDEIQALWVDVFFFFILPKKSTCKYILLISLLRRLQQSAQLQQMFSHAQSPSKQPSLKHQHQKSTESFRRFGFSLGEVLPGRGFLIKWERSVIQL